MRVNGFYSIFAHIPKVSALRGNGDWARVRERPSLHAVPGKPSSLGIGI